MLISICNFVSLDLNCALNSFRLRPRSGTGETCFRRIRKSSPFLRGALILVLLETLYPDWLARNETAHRGVELALALKDLLKNLSLDFTI